MISPWFFDISLTLARELSKDNEVVVICPGYLIRNDFVLKNNTFRQAIVNHPKNDDSCRVKTIFDQSPYSLIDLIHLIRFVRNFQPDIIHFQESGGFIYSFIQIFLSYKYKIVLSVHDAESHMGSESVARDLKKSLSIKFSTRIHTMSDYVKTRLIELYAIDEFSVRVIPLSNSWTYEGLEFKNIDSEKKIVLFFGRIIEYKGLEYLIRAEKLVRKEINNLQVVIAGRCHEKQYMAKFKKSIEGRKDIVILDRNISDYMASMLLRKSKIVVLPYIAASQSGVIGLAYSHSRPVIVTNVGGLSEYVDNGKTGFIVSPRSSEALADKIIKLLKDYNLRKEMNRSINEKIEGELSWKTIAESTKSYYDEIISSN